jgi:hypothetical protein
MQCVLHKCRAEQHASQLLFTSGKLLKNTLQSNLPCRLFYFLYFKTQLLCWLNYNSGEKTQKHFNLKRAYNFENELNQPYVRTFFLLAVQTGELVLCHRK